MTALLTTEAPPAPTSNSQDFVRLPAFPRSDSYVLTVVATNYIAAHPFKKTDDDGRETFEEAPAVELYFGGEIDGKPYFAKTWPQRYSLHEKANYAKWYQAITGNIPATTQRPADLVGKAALVEIKVQEKVGAKSKKPYTATNVGTVGKLPSVLAATAVPLAKLKPAFEAALVKSSEKAGGDDTDKAPF